MYYYLVAPTILVRKDQEAFTYQSEQELTIGSVVRVSVGKKAAIGVVMAPTTAPQFATKPVGPAIAPAGLPEPLLKLTAWLKTYYAADLPSVLQTLLPAGLGKQRRQRSLSHKRAVRKRPIITLNTDQSKAIEAISQTPSRTFLLHGVTGSGKTQVYIELTKRQLKHGRSVIMLAPEIALTPQLVAEFSHHFTNTFVTHSHMTEAERQLVWSTILTASEPVVVIGPRSALFMPVANLGLIIIDECHESSFKQEQSPKYSALRAASMLAQFHKAKVVFGSATPSVSDYYLIKAARASLLELPKTAVPTTPPRIELIDCTNRDNFREHYFISDRLLQEMRQTLAMDKQVLIFHNRRGTAPTTLCTRCGWTALCSLCFVPLTLHADQHKLLCHLCGRREPVLPICPECHNPDITFKGIGTKLVEDTLGKLFPKARIARFDADAKTQATIAARYQELYDGEIDIVIGTQMLAKGLDLPNLRTVGIIQADIGLQLPDYQAQERTFQLLYQVCGRVGRTMHESSVVIQTYQPNNQVVQLALHRDYAGFYKQEIDRRRQAQFPPFTHLLKLTCSYKTESGAIKASQKIAKDLQSQWPQLTILGPSPAFHERLGNAYRWQLIVKSKRRADLVTVANQVPPTWQVDLDPVNLL